MEQEGCTRGSSIISHSELAGGDDIVGSLVGPLWGVLLPLYGLLLVLRKSVTLSGSSVDQGVCDLALNSRYVARAGGSKVRRC